MHPWELLRVNLSAIPPVTQSGKKESLDITLWMSLNCKLSGYFPVTCLELHLGIYTSFRFLVSSDLNVMGLFVLQYTKKTSPQPAHRLSYKDIASPKSIVAT